MCHDPSGPAQSQLSTTSYLFLLYVTFDQWTYIFAHVILSRCENLILGMTLLYAMFAYLFNIRFCYFTSVLFTRQYTSRDYEVIDGSILGTMITIAIQLWFCDWSWHDQYVDCFFFSLLVIMSVYSQWFANSPWFPLLISYLLCSTLVLLSYAARWYNYVSFILSRLKYCKFFFCVCHHHSIIRLYCIVKVVTAANKIL